MAKTDLRGYNDDQVGGDNRAQQHLVRQCEPGFGYFVVVCT